MKKHPQKLDKKFESAMIIELFFQGVLVPLIILAHGKGEDERPRSPRARSKKEDHILSGALVKLWSSTRCRESVAGKPNCFSPSDSIG